MKPVLPFAAVSLIWLAWIAACSSTQTTPPPQDTAQHSVNFETRKDTVHSGSPGDDRSVQWETGTLRIRFMVQIGAFSNPRNASLAQSIARERFHVPVLNDYHTELKLYQVRIGFFEDFETASAFRSRLQSEFPGEYDDAWIVRLRD